MYNAKKKHKVTKLCKLKYYIKFWNCGVNWLLEISLWWDNLVIKKVDVGFQSLKSFILKIWEFAYKLI